MDIGPLSLPSGCVIKDPLKRALDFCREEYFYYDGIPSSQPNRIEPIDVLVTIFVNSWIASVDSGSRERDPAAKIRRIHRELAGTCNALLTRVPEDADLLTFDLNSPELQALMSAACRVSGVKLAVATKVLHRKRPNLIPMLDSIIQEHYNRSQDQFTDLMRDFRNDLMQGKPTIDLVRHELSREGYELSAVRLLEFLIWTEKERRGVYRR